MVTICEVKHKHPLVCVSLQSYIPVAGAGLPFPHEPCALPSCHLSPAAGPGFGIREFGNQRIKESCKLEKIFKIVKSSY